MDLSDLNIQQRTSILESFTQNTVVVASAGSGKTRTLTRRVGYLIENMGIYPEEIMVVTFTNKAANELKIKLLDIIPDIDDMWIGTFHSICVKMLRKFGGFIGIESFSILSPYTQKSIMKEILKKKNLPYETSDINRTISKISKYKANLINPKIARDLANTNEELALIKAYEEYQNHCWKNKTFDFDDLIVYTVYMLTKSKDVQTWFREHIKYIMCDETQDTNGAQFSFLKVLAGPNNMFLVGDDMQSIYSFRAAKPAYILNFQKLYANAKVLMLEQNYRSTKTIVNASNAITEYNKVKYKKNAFSENKVGDPIIVHQCYGVENEAEWVVNEIINTKTNGIKYDETVVLYRTNSQSRAIEEQLMKNGIPYKLVGAIGFYERKEIKDIMAFLTYMVNNKDEEALKRALISLPGVGEKTIDKLIADAKKKNILVSLAIKDFKCSSKAKTSLEKFIGIIAKIALKPSEIIEDIALESGILTALREEGTQEALSRIENITELINIAIEGENRNSEFGIINFLDKMALMSQTDKTSEEGFVNLMTIHASKGLEFKSVFIIGVEEKLLPHSNSKTPDTLEEERRLFYVAMTRAKEQLYITHCITRIEKNTTYCSNKSRFINEIPDKYKIVL